MDPHIRSKLLHPLRMEVPYWQTKKPSSNWSEHFEGLSSDQRTTQESSLAKILQVDVKLELDKSPTREEIRKATIQLKVGKKTGIDGIPAEVYQYGGGTALD